MIGLIPVNERFILHKSYYWNLNSGIVLGEGESAVLDPGYSPGELAGLEDFLAEKKAPPRYVIFTHSDFDHITGGACFAGAQKVAQENFNLRPREEQEKMLREADEAQDLTRPGFVFPQPQLTFQGGLELPLRGGVTLSLFAVPGHTPDSLVVLLKDQGILFAGDILSDLEFPLIFHSGKQYQASLGMVKELVEKYQVDCLVPGHGNPARGAREIGARIQEDLGYLDTLVGEVEDLFLQGLARLEMKSYLREMRYKGDYIGAQLMPHHESNIDLVIQETWDNL